MMPILLPVLVRRSMRDTTVAALARQRAREGVFPFQPHPQAARFQVGRGHDESGEAVCVRGRLGQEALGELGDRLGEGPQLLGAVGAVGGEPGQRACGFVLVREEDVLLGTEMSEEGCARAARGAGDLLHRRLLIALGLGAALALPALAAEWFDRYDAGYDVTHWYTAGKQSAHV